MKKIFSEIVHIFNIRILEYIKSNQISEIIDKVCY
jgi:hypothetical protein